MAYRTVSYDALAVITGMPPLHLLAEERSKLFEGMEREAVRMWLEGKWQNEWISSENG